MSAIGWKFPSTDGGVESGFNDAGIVTFDGAPLPSLARETIQNSLDAREREDAPVHVEFELQRVPIAEVLGGPELALHLDRCVEEWSHDVKAHTALIEARHALDADELTFLGVVDSNTTGLRGQAWHTLVKVNGASFKRSEGAGGSFGVGKAAPFTVSPLRTVCYWSAFEEAGQLVEKFQGKAVLVSHTHDFDGDSKMTQGVGFYGYTDECRELSRKDIPQRFRRVRQDGTLVPGTAVWIAGFNANQHGEHWQQAIARSVVASFFYAINSGELRVLLEPDAPIVQDDALWEIGSQTLPQWFERLAPHGADVDESVDDGIRSARVYWELVRSDEPTAVMDPPDPDLGAVKLWVGTEDDLPDYALPNRVALIRGTGMVVTDRQKGHAFRGLRDYAAVCVIDDAGANKLLRGMENPSHDQFEYPRLPEDERDRGRIALDRLKNWLRGELRKYAAPAISEVTEEVDELAAYLPDDRPGPFADGKREGDTVKAFGEIGEVLRKAPRRPAIMTLDDDADDEAGEDGGNAGGSGDGDGGGGGGGSGDGPGPDGPGNPGGRRGRTAVVLRDVRVLHMLDDPQRCRVSFSAEESGVVVIQIEEAGDSSVERRTDLKAYDRDGTTLDLDRFRLISGRRHEFDVAGHEPTAGIAWRVSAVKEPVA